jgi:hypothetical protein
MKYLPVDAVQMRRAFYMEKAFAEPSKKQKKEEEEKKVDART